MMDITRWRCRLWFQTKILYNRREEAHQACRMKASKYWRMAKVALTLIISAVFGDPTTAVATLIASLLSS
jgi:hypothetical protein